MLLVYVVIGLFIGVVSCCSQRQVQGGEKKRAGPIHWAHWKPLLHVQIGGRKGCVGQRGRRRCPFVSLGKSLCVPGSLRVKAAGFMVADSDGHWSRGSELVLACGWFPVSISEWSSHKGQKGQACCTQVSCLNHTVLDA